MSRASIALPIPGRFNGSETPHPRDIGRRTRGSRNAPPTVPDVHVNVVIAASRREQGAGTVGLGDLDPSAST